MALHGSATSSEVPRGSAGCQTSTRAWDARCLTVDGPLRLHGAELSTSNPVSEPSSTSPTWARPHRYLGASQDWKRGTTEAAEALGPQGPYEKASQGGVNQFMQDPRPWRFGAKISCKRRNSLSAGRVTMSPPAKSCR